MSRLSAALLACLLTGCATAAPAPADTMTAPAAPAGGTCSADAGWDDAAPPRHIFATTWYVGTCGVSAILITSPQGHVLIDGTTAKSADLVARNIRASGFRLDDVRFILSSHAHLDHAGGLRELQQRTGGVVVARGADADALERGRGDRSDPQFLSTAPFTPVAGVRRVVDGETIRVGNLAVVAHATPGHTSGGTSWSWQACDKRRCLQFAYADSLAAISDDSFQFSDDQAHPGYLEAFRRSIAMVGALPCDVLLTPHPNSSFMWQRLDAGGAQRLVDRGACRRYAEFARQALAARLAKERQSGGLLQ